MQLWDEFGKPTGLLVRLQDWHVGNNWLWLRLHGSGCYEHEHGGKAEPKLISKRAT